MMPKQSKRERGRPQERVYPPRIDATPEDIARAMLGGPSKDSETKTCSRCGNSVHYPETLYKGRLCPECHGVA